MPRAEFVYYVLIRSLAASVQTLPAGKFYRSKIHFTAGSEWLYFKIYSGIKTADTFLVETLRGLCETLVKQKMADKWFFIRYKDPEPHLRFRVHLPDLEHLGAVLRLVNETMEAQVASGEIYKLQLDTYKRELDRYGDRSIELAESVFYRDSVFTLNLLARLGPGDVRSFRWKAAVRSVDAYLDDFGLSVPQKFAFTKMLSEGFFKEHGSRKELKVYVDQKFRKLKTEVNALFEEPASEDENWQEIIRLLAQRSQNIKPLAAKMVTNLASDGLNIDHLVASFIHMNQNRIFMGRQRTNEYVVYELCARHYNSHINKLKHSQQLV